MATADDFQLGLLPERKMDWRTLVTSYGLEVLLLLFLINVGLSGRIVCNLAQKYHVTELVPLPSLQPQAVGDQAQSTRCCGPNCCRRPRCSTTPKLTVPREIHVAPVKPQEVAAPKVMVNTFQAPRLIQTAGGARPGATGADRRVRQFRDSDHQRPDPESADRRLWRSQWVSRAKAKKTPTWSAASSGPLICPRPGTR